jgi:hypothetical protein
MLVLLFFLLLVSFDDFHIQKYRNRQKNGCYCVGMLVKIGIVVMLVYLFIA